MKKVLWLLLTAQVFLTCKKDATLPGTEACRVSSIVEHAEWGDSRSAMLYDDQGRIINVDEEFTSDYEWITSQVAIRYAARSIVLTGHYRNVYGDGIDEEAFEYRYTLDDNGRIVSADHHLNGELDYRTSYVYSDGYLTQIHAVGPHHRETIEIEYANGNIMKVRSYSDDTDVLALEYMYNTNQPFYPLSAPITGMFFSENESFRRSHMLYVQGYFGYLPRNQLAASTNGRTTDTFTYEKDGLGRIHKMRITYAFGTADAYTSEIDLTIDCPN